MVSAAILQALLGPHSGTMAPLPRPSLASAHRIRIRSAIPIQHFKASRWTAKGGIAGAQIGVAGVASDLRSPYTVNFNLAFDRQLTPGFVVSLGYAGSHSSNLISAGGNTNNTSYGNDVNIFNGDLIQHINCKITPATGTAAASSSCSGVQTRLNSSFGNINYSYNTAVANYSGLIASARGRFTRRGFLTASYTWGHSLDDWQNYPVASPTNQFYANSPYDVRHRLSVGASYELPGGQFGQCRCPPFSWRVDPGGHHSAPDRNSVYAVTNNAAFQAQLIDIKPSCDSGQPSIRSRKWRL